MKGDDTVLFSERYKEIIRPENGEYNDDFIGEIWIDKKEKIIEVMEEFDQPQNIKESRYSDEEVETSALVRAIEKYNSLFHYTRGIIGLDYFGFGNHPLLNITNDALWDLIELQYGYLSVDEQTAFQSAMNRTLEDQELPWKLLDGRMVKLDSEQFSFDIKMKTLNELAKLRDEDAKFQGAFDELQKAFSSYDSGNYAEAVNWAEMSYESMLKVINGADKGNASALTKTLVDNGNLIHLPETITPGSFKDNVLMTLPYIRNNVTAHGSGSKQVNIDGPLANLAINMACALETYLVEVYRKCNK